MNILFRHSFVSSFKSLCDIRAWVVFPFVGNSSTVGLKLQLPYQYYLHSRVAEHHQRESLCLKYSYRCSRSQVSCYFDNAGRHSYQFISSEFNLDLLPYLSRLTIMGKTKAGGFYAVARGRSVGVFLTWDECKAQVDGFQNAKYKKFPTPEEANSFIGEHGGSSASFPAPSSFKRAAGGYSKAKGAIGLRIVDSPASTCSGAPKRDFSSLKVTEDRVINKRSKVDETASVSKNDLDSGGFSVDHDGYVIVYTDGACSKNGRNAAKAGIGVWFGNGHPLNVSEPVEGRQTNNTAEIQAAERAIREAKLNGINKLVVKTDSQFTINCVTKWLKNWKRNNWQLSSGGGEVKNKEDLIKLDNAMKNMEIKWSYVAGHAGIEGNDAADRLAVQGAARSKY